MKRLLALLLAIGMLSILAAPVAAAKPAGTPQGVTTDITGTFTDEFGGTGEVTGTFALDRFTLVGGELAAVGTLTATLTDSTGTVLGTVTRQITELVTAVGTCDILHLELGPLDLNLLGLVVHLDQIVLDIDAQSGPGNLLGNLLCGIAGLLDSNVIGNVLVNLLNQLLSILR